MLGEEINILKTTHNIPNLALIAKWNCKQLLKHYIPLSKDIKRNCTHNDHNIS
jgi:hypothetical protein